MAEVTKLKEVVQYKSEDVSVYVHKDIGAATEGEAVDVWSADVSGLEADLAKDLMGMIVEQERPLTVCLNGKWGTGKTFFLTRLVETYKNDGGTALYYNAWQDDFLDDPLVSIISQLDCTNISSAAFAAVKKVARPLLAGVGWGIAKKIVSQVAKNKLGIDIADLSIADADAIAGRDALDDYKALNASRAELREAISDLAMANWKDHHYPLLFVIDELDRCRPTFAIEVLERIKHIFSVDHLVFVIGADKLQLSESIRSVYGNIDVQDYLNRFFDLELHLAEVSREAFVDRLWAYLDYEKIMPSKVPGCWQCFLAIFKDLIWTSQLSLRQVEHCIRLLPFINGQLKRQRSHLDTICLPLLAAGIILKVVDNGLFGNFLHGRLPIHEVLNALFKERGEGWRTEYSESVVRILYGAFYMQENHRHDIRTLVHSLSTRGRIGVGDLAAQNAKGELPAVMESWTEDAIKKFYHDVGELLVHKDRFALGVKDPTLTLHVLHYALMLT